ncbi:MAG: glycosyltransferase [Ginsengibacter sp.]
MATNISIITPAYNAATTIVATLESLLAQTSPQWEAIIIDDGSFDETIAIVNRYIEKDKRIRILSQSNQGVSVARNTGIVHANFEWLLFLDADDWISPNYIERAINLIVDDPDLDAVHCGWVRIAPNGTRLKEKYAPESSDLFPVLAKTCPFAVHSCVVKKTVAEKVGKFDPSVKNCQDWDFWQRVARTGAKFGAVKEVLALYRMQANSLSSDRNQFYSDAMRMLIKGHSRDPRVLNPHPNYVNGQPIAELSSLKLYLTSWFAGLLLGQEKDAQHLLKFCENDHEPNLDPFEIAENIFETALIGSNLPLASWHKLWPKIDKYISEFLAALELQSKSEGLARNAVIFLEGMILQHTQLDQPVKIGTTQGFLIEVTEPIRDIYPMQNIERLYCMVKMEGNNLGKLELPVCDTIVPAWLIKDAIAAQFAWQILRRFFEYTVYPEIIERQNESQSQKDFSSGNIHDHIGWKIFLQQLWAQPNPQHGPFHKSKCIDKMAIRLFWNPDLSVVEISNKLPKLIILFKDLRIVLKIGGVSTGVILLSANNLVLTSRALKKIINKEGNFELCRVCVREALIGKPLNGRTSLQERLKKGIAVIDDKKNATSVDTQYFPAPDFVTDRTIMLAHRYDITGTSSSRRAILPTMSKSELIEMAKSSGEQTLHTTNSDDYPDHILYIPELIKSAPVNSITSTNQNESIKTGVNSSISRQGTSQFKTLNKSSAVTQRLAILKYHHITPTGTLNINSGNVTPESFEEQLQYLQENNYYSVNWDDWINAMFKRTPLPGKAVAITFDDGYLDFYQYSWPLLRKYGFIATVFLTTNYIGQTNMWDKDLNGEIPIMGWEKIFELQKEGVQFGSHSCTHRSLTALLPADIVLEAAKSRTILQQKLGEPIRIFAYPHGHTNSVVEHLIGACGYVLGLSSTSGLSTFTDNVLSLPCLEIKGSDKLQDFEWKLIL